MPSEREPGADDETDVEFWRRVMEWLHPPLKHEPLRARTPQETRAIMGSKYRHGVTTRASIDPIDAEDEAAALAEVLGPAGYAENRL